jgi:hypothetical protein
VLFLDDYQITKNKKEVVPKNLKSHVDCDFIEDDCDFIDEPVKKLVSKEVPKKSKKIQIPKEESDKEDGKYKQTKKVFVKEPECDFLD